MERSLADYFIVRMQKEFEKRDGVQELSMDMRGIGLDFYATLTETEPLAYFCRGIRYLHHADGSFTMEAGNGTFMPIDSKEYRSRLEYALSCIGADSEAGVSVLIKKHIKEA